MEKLGAELDHAVSRCESLDLQVSKLLPLEELIKKEQEIVRQK